VSIKKQHLKTKPICKVTFRITEDTGQPAHQATVVGDFNHWDPAATPMKKLKSGAFTVTLDLDAGKEYQFRYLLDGENWHNDEEADHYAPSTYHDTQNSVITV
jgi:1,4-alpha-glucan branching enzyme